MGNTVRIPQGMRTTTTQEIIDLRIAQAQARVDMRNNQFAWAMNIKLRMYFRDRIFGSGVVLPFMVKEQAE